MAAFDDFTKAVKNGSAVLAKEIFGELGKEARKDTGAFLEKTEQDMQRWTKQLSEGELTKQDFSDLVEAKEALAEIQGLTRNGVALTKRERFRKGLIKLVIDSAVDVYL